MRRFALMIFVLLLSGGGGMILAAVWHLPLKFIVACGACMLVSAFLMDRLSNR